MPIRDVYGRLVELPLLNIPFSLTFPLALAIYLDII